MEAEFFACLIAIVVQEAVWLKRIMQSLEIVKDSFGPTIVFSDSQAVIAFVKDPNILEELNIYIPRTNI